MNKKLVSLVAASLIVVLAGCASGMVGVYKGDIAANEAALHNLGPASEDTADEARRRKIHESKITEAKEKLAEVMKNNP